MKIRQLLEGTEPKMPGAPKGIQIMTPQQFVAKAGDMPGEDSDEEGVAEGSLEEDRGMKQYWAFKREWRAKHGANADVPSYDSKEYNSYCWRQGDKQQEKKKQGVAEGRVMYRDLKSWENAAKQQGLRVGHANGDMNYSYHATDKTGKIHGKFVTTHAPQNSRGFIHKQGVAEARNTNPRVNEIRQLAKDFFGQNPYSSGTIGGGKILRLSFHIGRYLDGDYRYVPSTQISPKDQQTLKGIKSKFEKFMTSKGVSADEVSVKFHIGSGVYAGVRIAIPQEQGVAEGATQASVSKVLRLIDRHNPQWFEDYGMGEVEDTVVELAERGDFQGMSAVDAMALVHGELEKYYGQLSEQGVAESEDHLSRIRKLSGLDEATKLPASSREFGGDEFQDYMKRIVGTPDIDKKTGQVKVDKKGIEKYTSGKTKTDKYKMPYIHRSSVVEYLGPDGKTYDEDKVKQTLAQRPKALLKQNEKMKHSNGELEQFFNVGFAALTGIALDQDTNKLIIVNTCPGAGSCKVDCFAMKGGKIQFKAAWQSDGRILTYLLNDPDGFFNQLSAEITKEEKLGQKGGYAVTIRWHDAGDFFSPEYLDMALKMAAKHPDTKFYAYTKIAGAALGNKPPNFIINWSEGAHTSQEKQVKAKDANLDTTKNSRIVPDEVFQDLLVKDQKGNLVKGPDGQWQVQPEKLPELKQRLAKEYGLSANSILSYDEYMAKRKSIPAGMKYNVIVAPGEGDISANDPNVIATLLLKH
jgi:Gene product 88